MEAPDRSSGIPVYKAQHGLSAGAVVDITGMMTTDGDSNRCISASTITTYPETGSVKPLLLSNRSIGGGPWFYDSGTHAGQAGVLLEPGKPSAETNNIGLLVQTTGKVTAPYASNLYFYTDDGSGLVSSPLPGAAKGIWVHGVAPAPDPLPPG